jgi:cobalt transporter subunit CbtB
MTTVTGTSTRALPAAAPDRLAALVLAAFLGLGLVYLSGFATPALLHNAAHDWRHANNFPCH